MAIMHSREATSALSSSAPDLAGTPLPLEPRRYRLVRFKSSSSSSLMLERLRLLFFKLDISMFNLRISSRNPSRSLSQLFPLSSSTSCNVCSRPVRKCSALFSCFRNTLISAFFSSVTSASSALISASSFCNRSYAASLSSSTSTFFMLLSVRSFSSSSISPNSSNNCVSRTFSSTKSLCDILAFSDLSGSEHAVPFVTCDFVSVSSLSFDSKSSCMRVLKIRFSSSTDTFSCSRISISLYRSCRLCMFSRKFSFSSDNSDLLLCCFFFFFLLLSLSPSSLSDDDDDDEPPSLEMSSFSSFAFRSNDSMRSFLFSDLYLSAFDL
mmetsp:Transcript_9500/g.23209  ORF Transcript_9500/g.23209 Transcript_9500/m.23209 type:complete len:324 (+) Transcript_9500:775-1746(+)